MKSRLKQPRMRFLLSACIALALLLLIVGFPVKHVVRDILPSVTSFNHFFARNEGYVRQALRPNADAEGFLYHHLRTEPRIAGRSLERLLDACWEDDAFSAPLMMYYLQASGALNNDIPFMALEPSDPEALGWSGTARPGHGGHDSFAGLYDRSMQNLHAFPATLKTHLAQLLGGSRRAAKAFENLRESCDLDTMMQRFASRIQDSENGATLSLKDAILQARNQVSGDALACAWFFLLNYCDCLDRVLCDLCDTPYQVDAEPLPESDCFPPGILFVSQTEYGTVLVGGKGDNLYPAKNAFLIIDLGGDDTYLFDQALDIDGETASSQGCSTIIDLSGNDFYVGGSGQVAAGVLGFGVIADLDGNDLYRAGAIGLGAGVMGFGLVVDKCGDDGYVSGPFSLGAAMEGMGIVIDDQGDDVYKSGAMSQGFAGPMGLGCLIECSGYDTYDAVPSKNMDLKHEPGYSQACFLSVAGAENKSGIALLLDLQGDDRYNGHVASQGASLGPGLALLLDARGHDIFQGRRQCQGYGSHGGIGMLRDQSGCDYYLCTRPAQGMGSVGSLGFLIDDQGDDLYTVQPQAVQKRFSPGTGMLFDMDGNDRYLQPVEPAR